MKSHLSFLTGACLLLNAGCVATNSASAQVQVPVSTAMTTTTTATSAVVAPTTQADEMEQLTAPIALYPDVLVALILPAATESSDVVLAARFLANGGNETQLESQPWDDSVKSLAHYPEVVKWMDENLEWTQQIGAAYLDKPEDVMSAVQRARARAMANGLLTSTPQQQVLVENGIICIVPAQPNVVYVPHYDPEILYVERPIIYRPDPWLTFGVGFGVGWWLSNDCDWHRRVIVVDHHRRDHWNDRRDWRHPGFAHRPDFAARDSHWRPWTPTPGRPHPRTHDFDRRFRPGVVRPAPIASSPGRDDHRRNDRPNWTRRDGRENGSSNPANRPNFPRANRVPVASQPAAPLNAASAAAAMPAPANVRPQPNVSRGERDRGQFTRRRDNDNGPRRHFAPAAAPQVRATAPVVVTPPNVGRSANRVMPAPAASRPNFTPNRVAPHVASSAPAPAPRVQSVERSAPAFTPRDDRPGGGDGGSRGNGGGHGGRGRSDRVDR